MAHSHLPSFLTSRGFSPTLITGLWIVYAKHYLTGFLLNFSYGSYVALVREIIKKQKKKDKAFVESVHDECKGIDSEKMEPHQGKHGSHSELQVGKDHHMCKKCGASYKGKDDMEMKQLSIEHVNGELETLVSFLLKYFPSLNKASRNHETVYVTVRKFWRVLKNIISDSNNTGRFLGYWTILYHIFIRVLQSRGAKNVSTTSMAISSFLSGFLVQFIYKGVSWKIAMYCLLRSLMGLTRLRNRGIAFTGIDTKITAAGESNDSGAQDIGLEREQLTAAVGETNTSGTTDTIKSALTTVKSHSTTSGFTIVDGIIGGMGALSALGAIKNIVGVGIPSSKVSDPSVIGSIFQAFFNKATLSYVLVNLGIGYNLYYYPDFMDVAYQNFLGSMACIYRYTTKDIIDKTMVETRPCYPYHPPIKNCWDSLLNRSPTIFMKVFKIYASVHLFGLLLSGQLWKRSHQPLLVHYGRLAKNFFIGVSRSCLFLTTQLIICGPSPCIHNYLANKFNNGKHSKFLMILPWMIGSFAIAFEAASRRSELALYSLWRLFICYVNRIRNVHSDKEHDPMFERLFSALSFGLATCFWIVVKNRNSSYLKRLDRMILSHVFPPHLDMKI